MTDRTQLSAGSEDARRKERVSMAREICMHRGENPDKIDRGGNADWEKYEPLAGAVIREAERLFKLRSSTAGPCACLRPGGDPLGNCIECDPPRLIHDVAQSVGMREALELADECEREFDYSRYRMVRAAKMLRALASQPSPAATVETSCNLATGERDNEETDPAYFHCSAATEHLADDIRHETKMVYIKRWRTIVRLPAKYADEIVQALRDEPQGSREWRCFHCGDVFTDEAAAKDHFGYDLLAEPGCKLNAIEGGLLGIVRRQEEQLQAYHREETASYREFYSLGVDHSQALIREEQKGYDKGLADARSEAVQAILKAPCLDENGYICEKAAVMAAFDPPLSRPHGGGK